MGCANIARSWHDSPPITWSLKHPSVVYLRFLSQLPSHIARALSVTEVTNYQNSSRTDYT